MIYVYQTSQGKNRRVTTAFAAGCKGKIVPPYPLQPEGDVAMFGCLRGLLPTLRQAQREGRVWYYIDNAYFRSERANPGAGYFRVTRNAMQHTGEGEAGPDRWRRLKLTIAPWRTKGSHIVVCPPARLHATILDFDADAWLKETLAILEEHTDRPIRQRIKMSYKEAVARGGVPLSEDLKGAWALVTHSSNAAVEALLAGVPVFCTDPCAAARIGLSDLTQIETPAMPEGREQWAWNLAAAQWQLDEMARGLAWKALNAAPC